MDKMTVVLDRKDIRLTCEGKALRVDCPDSPMQRIPLGMVGQVIVYGNPLVDCSVWRKLAEFGIQALLLPARGKGEPAVIGPGFSGSVMVRVAQYRNWFDSELKLKAAARAVGKKLAGYIRLSEKLEADAGVYKESLSRLGRAKTADALRGIEGAAAREWFAFMGRLLDPEWNFSGRNRRPPRDPVNALLSLGYTLMVSEVGKAVAARGLDPCLGFLHEPYPGRDSLVLDMAEAFRPGVDAIVLALTENSLSPGDFTTGKTDGCRLSKRGRGIFYQVFEEAKAVWPVPPVDMTDNGGETDLGASARRFVREFARGFSPVEFQPAGGG